jgi:hypothetical protein
MKPKVKNEASILLWDQLQEIHQRGFDRGEESHIFPSIFKEHRFHKERRWRFDFAIHGFGDYWGLEIEGGAWVKGGGGHNRGKAFIDDMEKYNHAALLGWKVLRFTPAQVLDGTAIAFIKRVLES